MLDGKNMRTARDFLADLIAIRTDGSVDGVEQCVAYICDVLQRNGIIFECLKHSENGKVSVVAGINIQELQNISGGLVLSGHIDTVSANEKDWNTAPFELTDINGKLYGRGTVDMKYFTAVLLAELTELQKKSFPIFLVFTSDEETDVCGIREIISFFQERHIYPQYALIGEPTNFKVCVANKGYAGYRTMIKGVAAHSSCPELGVNAAYIAAKLVSEIENLNALYKPLGTTLNVGVLRGGKERNSIADEMLVDWEVRYVLEEHKASILQAISLFQENLLMTYPKAEIELLVQETLPAFAERTDGHLAEIMTTLLQTERLSLKYATEAGFFQQAGMETIICGAGDESLAHTSTEYILDSDIERYVVFLRDFLQRLSEEKLK